MAVPVPVQLELEQAQEDALRQDVRDALGKAIDSHEKRQKFQADLYKAYRAQPDYDEKTFPWKGASNVVVPYVAIAVDAIAARLQRGLLSSPDLCTVHLRTPQPFLMQTAFGPKPLEEKDVKDWVEHWAEVSGTRDRLRTIIFDLAQTGDAFVKPMWTEESETYHGYSDQGDLVELPVPGYTGVKLHVVANVDALWPDGYDSWGDLPWFATRLRMTWAELKEAEQSGVFQNVDSLKGKAKSRDDAMVKVLQKAQRTTGEPDPLYDLYEIHGIWELKSADESQPSEFQEMILVYSYDHDVFLRMIYNPYFGRSRHFVKIPFLQQPHQVAAIGVAEMSLPFQKEATTAHNQVIDAATASNAGIVISGTDSGIDPNQEIYPGVHLKSPNPKDDFVVVHMNEASSVLGQVEEKAAFLMEKRTGVSVYNLGMESATVGSRATATGTTALISEGNMRFWVSIDDMRYALEELIYLVIQQEQQFRPQGYEWAPGRFIQFPQGDPRLTIGLTLKLTSETINKDLEIQQLQILMQVMVDYYMRLNQAAAVLFNPQFPPQQKMIIVQTMQAMNLLIKKFVERFDIEQIDLVAPSIVSALQGMTSTVQMMGGGAPNAIPGSVAQPAGAAPPLLPGGTGPGASSLPASVGRGEGSVGDSATTGRGSVPVT